MLISERQIQRSILDAMIASNPNTEKPGEFIEQLRSLLPNYQGPDDSTIDREGLKRLKKLLSHT